MMQKECSLTSANALLKIFEEPPPKTVLILISSRPFQILPTILSRCQKIFFSPLSEQEMDVYLEKKKGLTKNERELLIKRSEGSLGKALRLKNPEEEHLRKELIQFLIQKRYHSFTDLKAFTQIMGEKLEAMNKEQEEVLRDLIKSQFMATLTPLQKENSEKQVAGMVSREAHTKVHSLFTAIISYFRDMHLLLYRGDSALLYHGDFREDIEQAVQRGEIRPLEDIQKILERAALSFERFTSFSQVLETLFLELQNRR